MDIGIHLSSGLMMSASKRSSRFTGAEILRQQIARRTWLSVFCLDRVVSQCLGRPVAIHEKDCCCELPMDMSDEDLEMYCARYEAKDDANKPKVDKASSSPLTGFIAFARLCQISGRVQQLGSPLRLRALKSFSSNKAKKYLSRVSALDHALHEWPKQLPASIHLSGNPIDNRSEDSPGLVMRMLISIVHAGSTLNLYR
jgi:hypothetical protein